MRKRKGMNKYGFESWDRFWNLKFGGRRERWQPGHSAAHRPDLHPAGSCENCVVHHQRFQILYWARGRRALLQAQREPPETLREEVGWRDRIPGLGYVLRARCLYLCRHPETWQVTPIYKIRPAFRSLQGYDGIRPVLYVGGYHLHLPAGAEKKSRIDPQRKYNRSDTGKTGRIFRGSRAGS